MDPRVGSSFPTVQFEVDHHHDDDDHKKYAFLREHMKHGKGLEMTCAKNKVEVAESSRDDYYSKEVGDSWQVGSPRESSSEFRVTKNNTIMEIIPPSFHMRSSLRSPKEPTEFQSTCQGGNTWEKGNFCFKFDDPMLDS